MSNQSDDSSFNTSSWDEAVIRRMDESIVAQRHQMNQTSLKFRHLALNAEGKRALNSNVMITEYFTVDRMINCELTT